MKKGNIPLFSGILKQNWSPPSNQIRTSLIQTDSPQDRIDHTVRVTVGAGTTVLKVTAAVVGHATGNANGCTAMCHSGAKVGDVTRLMSSGQATLVVPSTIGIVRANMAVVRLGQLLNGLFDHSENFK